jgi:serine 3-dehydrogenase
MQTILITGVTSGLGQASARLFIQHGWRVIGTGRRKERLDALAQELGSLFLGLCFDIQDKIQIEQNLSKIPNDFSQIDVLLNNAGLFLGNAPAQTSLLED